MNRFVCVELPAIRDVVRDMGARRSSPLHRLISLITVPADVKAKVEAIVSKANEDIRDDKFFTDLQDAIDANYIDLAAVPEAISVKVGLADPTFNAAIGSISLLLTDPYLSEAAMSRNSLGFNNLLFFAILLEFFKQRAVDKGTNQILLFEEPEAHLHQNAQAALMRRMINKTHQTVLTSHSGSVIAALGVEQVTAVYRSDAESRASSLVNAIGATPSEVADLNRYLDLNRSALLFARRIILVEGISEELLITAFAEARGINLSQANVSIVSVVGTHFDLFARLFASGILPSRCQIVSDGDAQNSAAWIKAKKSDDGSRQQPFDNLGVPLYKCLTTFELTLTQRQNVSWITNALRDAGATTTATSVARQLVTSSDVDLHLAQLAVLRAAKRIGKGRFAQALARSVKDHDVLIPPYISRVLDDLQV